jgi:hypothetical protein
MDSGKRRRLADAADDLEQIRRSLAIEALSDEIRGHPEIGSAIVAAIEELGTMPHADDADLVTDIILAVSTVDPAVADRVRRRLGMEPAEIAAG